MTTPWLTPDEAAAYTHKHKRTLAREVKRGRLRAARIGGRGDYRYRTEWLDEWVENQATPIAVAVPRRRIG